MKEVYLKVSGLPFDFSPLGRDFENTLLFSGALLFFLSYRFFKFEFLYIFLHEFTHLVFGILFFKKIIRFKVSKLKGEVVLSGTNPVILLAPYFFPLSTFILLLAGFLVWNFFKYIFIWYFTITLVGFSLMLHIVMTLKSLMVKQTDIKTNGYFFSLVIIYFLSVSLITGIIILLLKGHLETISFFRFLFVEIKNNFFIIQNILFN